MLVCCFGSRLVKEEEGQEEGATVPAATPEVGHVPPTPDAEAHSSEAPPAKVAPQALHNADVTDSSSVEAPPSVITSSQNLQSSKESQITPTLTSFTPEPANTIASDSIASKRLTSVGTTTDISTRPRHITKTRGIQVTAAPFFLPSSLPPPKPKILKKEASMSTNPGIASLLSEEETDILSCPVCLSVPLGQVLCCRNGHSFCAKCANKLKQCATCRQDFTQKFRNLAMEGLLDLKTFRCPYEQNGCTHAPMTRRSLAIHQLQCNFDPSPGEHEDMFCPFCNSFTFLPDSISKSKDEAVRLIDHLTNDHKLRITGIMLPIITICKVTTSILSETLSHCGNLTPKNKIFGGNVICVRRLGGAADERGVLEELYVVILRVDFLEGESKQEKALSVACVQLTPPSPEQGLNESGKLKFTMKASRRYADLSWQDDPLPVEQFNRLMMKKPEDRPKLKCSFPFSFLRDMCTDSAHGTGDAGDQKLTILVDFKDAYPVEAEGQAPARARRNLAGRLNNRTGAAL